VVVAGAPAVPDVLVEHAARRTAAPSATVKAMPWRAPRRRTARTEFDADRFAAPA